MAAALPHGVFPTMITPFCDDGSVDRGCLEALTEWYIASGCVGLFATCLSSEMYDLSEEERLELARIVKARANGRVPVVASGTFGGRIEEQAAFVNRMAKEVDAVVVITSNLATKDESDEVWLENAKQLLSLTTCSLGFYECPVPYKRVLSPELLSWAAASGRFLFHKDTCCISEQIHAKVQAVAAGRSNFRFYNANVETLKFSNEIGGAGFSGISANFYPWLHVRLCSADTSESDKNKIQRFLSVAELGVCDGYPKSAKAYLAQYDGFPIKEHTRVKPAAAVHFNEVQRLHLRHMKELMEDLCASLDSPVKPLAPVICPRV